MILSSAAPSVLVVRSAAARSAGRLVAGFVRALLMALALVGQPLVATAQPPNHVAHHPKDSAVVKAVTPDSVRVAPPAGQMMAGVGDMEAMHRLRSPSRRLLIRRLLLLDSATPNARQVLLVDAERRIQDGLRRIGEADQRLASEAVRSSPARSEAALQSLRRGVADVETGLTVRRALAEPALNAPAAGLRWFRTELGLRQRITDTLLGSRPTAHGAIMWALVLGVLILATLAGNRVVRASQLAWRLSRGRKAAGAGQLPTGNSS